MHTHKMHYTHQKKKCARHTYIPQHANVIPTHTHTHTHTHRVCQTNDRRFKQEPTRRSTSKKMLHALVSASLWLHACSAACSTEHTTDYRGNDLQPLKVRPAANASACCALCEANPDCFAWSLQPASACKHPGNCCYLKSSDAGRRRFAGAVSGKLRRPCKTEFDCSLGGVCSNGTCICDPTWKGETCASLNLLPAPTSKVWNYADNTYSWGGTSVYDKADGKWHLFFAEFLNHCGLGHWGTNSVVSHGISDAPDGPFTKKEVVLPAFHHNPTVAFDPSTETFLLISIGNGSTVPQHCGPARLSRQPQPVVDPAAAGIITLWYSVSANGPWALLDRPLLEGRPGKWDAFVTNPSVHVFPNGTVLMAYRGGWNPWHVGVAVAPSWKEPFRRVSDDPVIQVINEDPGLFQHARGHFHILTHYFGSDGPGGHAYSEDGIMWSFAGQAYNFSQQYIDGTHTTWQRRERPQVLVLDGTPRYLFTGVLPKGGERSHTLVQPIAT